MKTITKQRIINLCLSGVFIALSTGLSCIKVYQLPMGGSITLLSMLPITMLSCILGLKWGIASAFVYSLVQLALGIAVDGLFAWGLTPTALVATIFLDYVVPFTFLGFAGAFAKKGTVFMCIGTAAVIVLRFLCHLASGAVIFYIWYDWANVWVGSLIYNGSYMLPELIITAFAAGVLYSLPQTKKLIIRVQNAGK